MITQNSDGTVEIDMTVAEVRKLLLGFINEIKMKKIFLVLLVCLIFGISIPAQTIIGKWNLNWIVIELDMAYSIMAPITLIFEDNGTFSGNGGCNNITGKYSFKKPKKPFKKPVKITFKDIIIATMVCEKTLQTEKAFVRSLREANSIKFEGEELVISSSKIGNTMNFVRDLK